MYYDYYLRFTDEAESIPVIYNVIPEQVDEEGVVVQEEQLQPKYLATDVIGVIYKLVDDSDPENPVYEPYPGWHVNIRNNALAPELVQYTVHPPVPYRIWAGGPATEE